MRSLHKTLRFIACIYPIVIHIVIILNFMSYFIGVDFTSIVYPIFGHSVSFDFLLLVLSRVFKILSVAQVVDI